MIQSVSNGCQIYILNGILEEEVYIEQPKGFVDRRKRNMVYKIHKALNALKQDPGAWYEILHTYLVKISFARTNDNENLCLKTKYGKGILLADIFVDNIIFVGQDALCKIFANEMMKEFEISMFEEIKKNC